MELRERAIEAWAEEERVRMETQERTDAGLFRRAKDHFSETFGMDPDIVRRTDAGVEVGVRGGWVFLFNLMGKTYRLWGECPECGGYCWSYFFKTLGGLGEMLVMFKPDSHPCGTPEVAEDDVSETLRKAFRAFVEASDG